MFVFPKSSIIPYIDRTQGIFVEDVSAKVIGKTVLVIILIVIYFVNFYFKKIKATKVRTFGVETYYVLFL